MNSDELFEHMKLAARELNTMDEFGGLHIFVSDGNCEDEHVEWILEQTETPLTDKERDFAQRMLSDFTEEQRFGVWAFAQCADLHDTPAPPVLPIDGEG